MSLFSKRNSITETNDANLVMLSLGGDREAFCEIVSRYQNLLCSLAYSSVGDIKYSEDISQEAFVEAWKKLDTLKDPEKLKAWLCGILRFKISRYRRKENTQPTKAASSFEEHDVPNSDNDKMEDTVIREQEQALLWQTLDKMDGTYREPLILFYREQQSVERVAAELDLSVDTTKQRLSRGRKLLKRAMISFVEETLTKSKPGVGFTAGVLAAISSIAPPAKAAVIGTGVTKAGTFIKLGTLLTFLAAFSGVISTFFGLRASLDQSRTQRERQNAYKVVAMFMLTALIYVFGMFTLKYFALNNNIHNDVSLQIYAIASQLMVLTFVATYLFLVYRMFKQTQNIRTEERIFNPQAFQHQADQIGSKKHEYQSKISLLGTPLFHFKFGMLEKGDKPAIGWIAGGSKAYGLLFAWGGVAIAPISVGIISVGIISVGAVGFGILAIGTVAIGIIGFGASAIGYKAYGSLSALGWESAFSNGFSIAKDAALGPVAFADQINNELAANISNLTLLGQSHQWIMAFIAIVVIIPSIFHSYKVRQRMK
ncbi:MAG: sigma-70 family RNA polymerase sigma factor [Colwellia sp.]|nr:sigma-70 family RNA polymerase sigma factor [Colwellia sp.]